jgi:hypothetical protein
MEVDTSKPKILRTILRAWRRQLYDKGRAAPTARNGYAALTHRPPSSRKPARCCTHCVGSRSARNLAASCCWADVLEAVALDVPRGALPAAQRSG